MCKKNSCQFSFLVCSQRHFSVSITTHMEYFTYLYYIHTFSQRFFSEEVFDHLLEKLFALKGQHSTKLFKNFMSLRKNSGCQQDEFIS